MDKYKYQLLVIALTLCIGGIAGYLVASTSTDTAIHKLAEERVRTLEKEVAHSKLHIDSLNKLLVKRDSLSRADSLTVAILQKQIAQEKVKTKKKIEEAKKLTPNEKARYLIDRYRTK